MPRLQLLPLIVIKEKPTGGKITPPPTPSTQIRVKHWCKILKKINTNLFSKLFISKIHFLKKFFVNLNMTKILKSILFNKTLCSWIKSFKVARVVDIRLGLMNWLFHNLITQTKLYYFREARLFVWKIWWAPTTIEFNVFGLHFAQAFLLNNL